MVDLPDDHTAVALPLAGLRVVEWTSGIAAAYTGRILTDCGAMLTKLVGPPRPAGEDLLDGIPAAAARSYLDLGKQLVRLPDEPATEAELAPLLADADIILTDAGEPGRPALSVDRLRELAPTAILTSVTPFGLSGPYRDYRDADELIMAHLGGSAYGTPIGVKDLAAEPPLRSGGIDLSVYAGVLAATATLGCALRTDRRAGHLIDVAIFEAAAALSRLNLASVSYAGISPTRSAKAVVARAPAGFMPCADGAVTIHCSDDHQWRRLVRVMGDPEWAAAELFATADGRGRYADALEAVLAEWFAGYSKAAATELLQSHGLVCFPYLRVEQLREDEQLRARGALRQVSLGGAPLTVPGPAFRLLGMAQPDAAQVAPAPGASSVTGTAARHQASPAVTGTGAPLAGIRVVDLSTVIAGPHCTQLLAQLGAEVLKVESPTHPDLTRTKGPYAAAGRGPEYSGYFHSLNDAKKSVLLDLHTADGQRNLDRLVAEADVLVENFSLGAAAKLKVSYQRFAAVNPAVVQVSLSGLGRTGPDRHYVTYGPQLMARAGWNSLISSSEKDPRAGGGQLIDQLSGAHAACAVITALIQRGRLGAGQLIDLSMLECTLPIMALRMIEAELVRETGSADGVRIEPSIYGAFPSAGEDRWVAIAVSSDGDWQALRQVMGSPEWSDSERFGTEAARRAHRQLLATGIAEWTRTRSADEAFELLQGAGLAAARTSTARDLAEDPHLRARGFYAVRDYPGIGPCTQPDMPFVIDRRRSFNPARAPSIGEHTDSYLPCAP